MGTGFFPQGKARPGVKLTPHPLLVPWSKRIRALLPLRNLRPLRSLSACTTVHLTFTLRNWRFEGLALWVLLISFWKEVADMGRRLFRKTIFHHHHHVPEGLGVFPVPWSSRWSWSLHKTSVIQCSFVLLFYIVVLVLVVCLCPSSVHVVATFGLYCSACFGSLSVSILCTCCSHFWFIL